MNETRPRTPFVVLFQGRSGSTFLVECLQDHPAIQAEKEVFSVMVSQKQTAEDQLSWAREFFTADHSSCAAVGFKTKLKDVLDPEGFAELLKSVDGRVILLLRRNLVKLVVSLHRSIELNKATGRWNLYTEADRPEPLAIEPERFDTWLEKKVVERAETAEYAHSVGVPVLELTYEALLTSRDQVFHDLFSFLEVPQRDVSAETRKNTSDDLREVLPNFEELKEHYEGTQFEAMFDEVLLVSDARDL